LTRVFLTLETDTDAARFLSSGFVAADRVFASTVTGRSGQDNSVSIRQAYMPSRTMMAVSEMMHTAIEPIALTTIWSRHSNNTGNDAAIHRAVERMQVLQVTTAVTASGGINYTTIASERDQMPARSSTSIVLGRNENGVLTLQLPRAVRNHPNNANPLSYSLTEAITIGGSRGTTMVEAADLGDAVFDNVLNAFHGSLSEDVGNFVIDQALGGVLGIDAIATNLPVAGILFGAAAMSLEYRQRSAAASQFREQYDYAVSLRRLGVDVNFTNVSEQQIVVHSVNFDSNDISTRTTLFNVYLNRYHNAPPGITVSQEELIGIFLDNDTSNPIHGIYTDFVVEGALGDFINEFSDHERISSILGGGN